MCMYCHVKDFELNLHFGVNRGLDGCLLTNTTDKTYYILHIMTCVIQTLIISTENLVFFDMGYIHIEISNVTNKEKDAYKN